MEECEDRALLAAFCPTSLWKPLTLGWLVLASFAPRISAAQSSPTVTLADDGLPGVADVALLDPAFHTLALAAGTDYGFTDAALKQGDRHHRVGLRLAGAWAPLPQLALGLQLAGRFDGHRDGDGGTDSGMLARPKLYARGRFELAKGYFLGGQIAFRPAPTSNLGTAIGRGSIGLAALGGAKVDQLSLGARVGFRFDGGKQALESLSTLSDNDRLALGISSAPEFLLGLSGLYPLQQDLALVGELTWDIPLGSGGLRPLAAPLWLWGGARWTVAQAWTVGGMIGISPSRRDGLPKDDGTANNDLARIDPRVYVGLSLTYSLQPDESEEMQSSNPTVTLEAMTGVRSVHVIGFEGASVEGAEVRSGSARCRTVGTGICDLKLTTTELSIAADGYLVRHLASTEIAAGLQASTDRDSGIPFDVELHVAPITLRGQVLDDAGQSIEDARISVMRGDRQREVKSKLNGRFALPGLSPGPVVLRVEAEGLQASERMITLVPNHPSMTLSPQAEAASGQVRGTVRTFDGTPLRATIKISPGSKRIRCGSDGTFRLDLPPGSYSVSVQAAGYRPQKREAVVEPGGVAVLLVELQSQP